MATISLNAASRAINTSSYAVKGRLFTKSSTLLPNLISYSANTKSINLTRSYYANNVPVSVPIAYSSNKDNILKLPYRSTTLLPNLNYFAANTKTIYLTRNVNVNNTILNIKTTTYIANSYTGQRIIGSSIYYTPAIIKQFWT